MQEWNSKFQILNLITQIGLWDEYKSDIKNQDIHVHDSYQLCGKLINAEREAMKSMVADCKQHSLTS